MNKAFQFKPRGCLLLIGLVACSSDPSPSQTPSLTVQTGGTTVTGGALNSGGTLLSSGGTVATTGGAVSTGGVVTTGGTAITGGADTTGGTATTGGAAATGGADVSGLENFSFFVTSLDVMRELSGSQDGFGGDLGGLTGADSICQQAADKVGFGAKTWRAFLSATDDGTGSPVHAIDRIGSGPWYDRNGRLIANDIAGLINRGTGSGEGRPDGDAQAVADLSDEFGQPLSSYGDSHDVLTATNEAGQLDDTDPASTCNDWTSTTAVPGGGGGGGGGFGGGTLRVGHAWPAMSGNNWIQAHTEASCAPGVNLTQDGAGDGSSVGAGGGWGGIYCFALTP